MSRSAGLKIAAFTVAVMSIVGLGALSAGAIVYPSEYRGIVSGYRTYCEPGSNSACVQSKNGAWFENANGVCRKSYQRPGSIRYRRSYAYFSASSGWSETHVLDCRWRSGPLH